MSKKIVFAVFIATIIFTSWFWWSYSNSLSQEIDQLNERKSQLTQENTRLQEDVANITRNYQAYRNNVEYIANENYTPVTIAYYTNFSQNQHFLSIDVSYEKYVDYKTMIHPIWDKSNFDPALDYITTNDTIIKQIVNSVKNKIENEEELANALLNFVQDKRTALNIRFYPAKELKYPIETLVEMGGDSVAHTILYLTLMKAAGFNCLFLYSNETINGQYHTAAAIKLKTPPKHLVQQYKTRFEIYEGELYYYAETTKGPINVGNIPKNFENLNFTKSAI